MSTRGLVGFTHKGLTIAFYNHYDSYLSNLGKDVAQLCLTLDLAKTRRRLDKLQIVSPENSQAEDSSGAIDLIDGIINGGITRVSNDIDFLKDRLFCEYAYIIDLDKRQVNVYSSLPCEVYPLRKLPIDKFDKDEL